MQQALALPGPSRAPSWILFGLEPWRAAVEYAAMRASSHAVRRAAGDGHPVVIFPGLASDQRSTRPLHDYCERLGYRAYDWGRGFNAGPKGNVERWLERLARDIDRLTAGHDQTMTLLGWSLGGIYAREVAKRLEGRVRQVITIGSPFAGTPEQSNVSHVYRLLSGQRAVHDPKLHARLKSAPPVPTTSIYSRSDGIVAWQACIQDETPGARVENVAVDGSHCGMGWNTAVLSVIADRLGQPEGHWRPYAER